MLATLNPSAKLQNVLRDVGYKLQESKITVVLRLLSFQRICQFAIISEVRVEKKVGFVRGDRHRFGSRLAGTWQETGPDPAAGRSIGFCFPSVPLGCDFELVGWLLAGWLGGWPAHSGWSVRWLL